MPDKKECMLAEIAGFIRVCGSIGLVGGGRFKIVLNTENNAVARHYKKLIREYFSVDAQIDVGQGQTLKRESITSSRSDLRIFRIRYSEKRGY